MSKLVLSGDTSGSVTLDAPAVSGTTTLTLPTTSGTVIASNSSGNVGIGTSTTNERLVINGSTNINSAIRLQNQGTNIGFVSTYAAWAGTGSDNTFSIASVGALGMMFATNGVERMRIDSSGNFTAVIPSGSTSYPAFWCRAWVNFNGTGTVAIRASGNVTSITDNGTGTYTVNFTTAMPDANYSYSHAYSNEANVQHAIGFLNSMSTSQLSVSHYSAANSGNTADKSFVQIAVFR